MRPETWEYVKYVMVFSTFPPRQVTTVDILQWYRVRWQVDLVFKRLKSLAQLGHLPKSDAQSARAWVYGTLCVVLLTEQIMRHGRTLSPSAAPGRTARAAQPVARVCFCLASAPASGRSSIAITVSDGKLGHDCPNPLRMPTSTATAARATPHSLKLTLMEIRPVALGRKNWMFCWTEVGAQHAGSIYSLLASGRLQGVDSYIYLVDVLQRVETHPALEVQLLTPRLWKAHFATQPLGADLDRRRQ